MRILILSPTPTSPQNYGNRVRIHRVLSRLKELGHEVHLVMYPSESDWRTSIPFDALKKMQLDWDSVNIVPNTRELHTPSVGEDHTIDEWWDYSIGDYLKWIFSKTKFDIFIINYTWLSKAFEFAPNSVLKVLDTHDKFADRRHILEKMGISPEFFHTTVEEERIALTRANLVLAIKEEEAQYFKENGSASVETLIHANHASFLPRRNRNGGLKSFGILAANNSINISNITRFIESAAPIFYKYLCPLEIKIYGGACKNLQHLLRFPFVSLQGYVEDQTEFYEGVDFVLIPMDLSTGLKIKAAEALAFGKPVIAHAHGFEGLAAFHPYQQLASFEEIANACITCAFDDATEQVLANATKRSQFASEGRFDNAINNIIAARSSVLPKAIFYIEVTNPQDLRAIQWIRDLFEYFSYKFDLGVVVQGQTTEQVRDILYFGDRYQVWDADGTHLQDPAHLEWLAAASVLITNSAQPMTHCKNAAWNKVFIDSRAHPVNFSRTRFHAHRDIQAQGLYVLNADLAIGGPNISGSLKKVYGSPRYVSLPGRFWKLCDPAAEITTNSERVYRYFGMQDGTPPAEYADAVVRSVQSDAGWAKLWGAFS